MKAFLKIVLPKLIALCLNLIFKIIFCQDFQDSLDILRCIHKSICRFSSYYVKFHLCLYASFDCPEEFSFQPEDTGESGHRRMRLCWAGSLTPSPPMVCLESGPGPRPVWSRALVLSQLRLLCSNCKGVFTRNFYTGIELSDSACLDFSKCQNKNDNQNYSTKHLLKLFDSYM